MNKIVKLSCALLGLFMLANCSSGIKNNVTRFHQLPPPGGQTIEVIAMDATLQQSIEFGSYAQMIGRKLGDIGYNPPQAGRSQYVAELSYNIAPLGGTMMENGSPISVGMGVGSGRRRGTSMGFGLSTSFGSSADQARFVSTLSVNIVDLRTGSRLYEGHVESINRNQNLAQIMPFMIEALFQNFPGTSGTSNTVRINPQ